MTCNIAPNPYVDECHQMVEICTYDSPSMSISHLDKSYDLPSMELLNVGPNHIEPLQNMKFHVQAST